MSPRFSSASPCAASSMFSRDSGMPACTVTCARRCRPPAVTGSATRSTQGVVGADDRRERVPPTGHADEPVGVRSPLDDVDQLALRRRGARSDRACSSGCRPSSSIAPCDRLSLRLSCDTMCGDEVVTQDGLRIHYAGGRGGPGDRVVARHLGRRPDELGVDRHRASASRGRLSHRGRRSRGHGQSDKPHDPGALSRRLDSPSDVTAVLDGLGCRRLHPDGLFDGCLHGPAVGGSRAPRAHARARWHRRRRTEGLGPRERCPRARSRRAVGRTTMARRRAIREYADATGADRLALAAIQPRPRQRSRSISMPSPCRRSSSSARTTSSPVTPRPLAHALGRCRVRARARAITPAR